MGILDELKKQFQAQAESAVMRDKQPAPQNAIMTGPKPDPTPAVRRLNTEPEQKPQPTQQMTALTAAINKWASKGTVVKDMPARRKLMFEPQPEKNWYSGEVPTNSEIIARIASISESDPAQSKELFNQYQTFANDPTSPLYNPYKTSTNKAITELQNLGFDMSGGVTDKWLQDNAWLMQYYRTETGNTPLAPTKKSSPQENAAYWYYKVLTAEETTQKAETEWQALQDEITYWANRSDRNYSDDEILAKIDWSNYKTLTGMDDGAAKGVPTTLNRAVGYSTDALKGVIWAARNGSTGDFTMDSVNAVLGKGKGWTKNNTIAQKLDPTSSKYSPYSVGSTLDEAAIYFGVQEFGKNWLDNNRALINSSDATERKMYTKVYNAEQTTQKAESELADLQKYVNSLIREGADPAKVADAIALYVDDSCPTLAKMDESLKSGDLMGTTRAVGYKLEDIQADARKRVDAANGKVGGGQYVQNLAKKFGANIKAMATDTQVQKWRDAFVQGAYDTIQKLGTDEEKISFGNGGSADYGAFLQQLVEVIGSTAPNGQEIVDDALAGADAFAKENYLDAYGVVHQYEEAQQALEDIQKELDELLGSPSARLPGITIASAGATDAPMFSASQKESMSARQSYQAWQNDNRDERAEWMGEMSDAGYSDEEILAMDYQRYLEANGGQANDEVYGDYTLNAVPENGAPRAANPEDQARVNLLYAQQQEQQARLEALQAQYDEKAAILKEAQENYEAAQRYAQTYGIDISNVGTLMQDFEIAWQLGSEYVPTEWTAYTLYGQAQKDNVAHATISETAKKNRAECMEAIAQIDSLLIRLGVNADSDGTEREQLVPDDFVDNITRYKESLEREMNAATYWLMQDAEGFEDTANQAREEINKQYNSSFIVGPDLKLMYQIANPDWEPDSVEDINTYVDQMTDDERNTYLYLWKSAGADAAREYYDYLTDDSYGVLTTRTNQAMQNAYTKMTQSGWLAGLGMNVMDVLASPMRLYGTAYTAIAGLQGKEINPNSKWFAASTMDTAVTSATTQSITDAFGEGTTLTWLAKLAYESGKSIAESMYTGHLFGGITGGGSGMFSEWLGAVPMGAEAVASAVQDAKLNGATNEQALAIGGITFFAETVSEAITIGNLKEALHKGGSEGLKASFKSILKNAFTEEAPGEMFNEAIESAADYWIMGDNSRYNQEVQRLMIEEGLSKDQAEDRALVGIVGDVLYAGLSGAVGGIMGGAPEAIAGKHAYNSAVRAIQKQTGLDFDSASKILDAMETARGAQQTNEATEAQEEKPAAPTDTGKSRQETFDEGTVAEQAPQNEITEEPVTPSETPAETPSEITEEPVTEAQPETASGSTLAPVDTSRFGQVGGSNRAANAAAALTASFGADTASRTETIGAALAPEDGQNIAPARTAAQHLAAKLGSNKAVGVMRGIVHATMDGNLNYETVQVAVTTAILNEGGQANAMLTNMAENGVTVENLTELVNEATTEAADPEVQAEMESTIRENEIAEHVKALVADGALNGLEPMKQSVTDAKNKRRAAKTALTKQVNKFNAAKQAFQEAQTAFRADPTNKDLKAAKNAKRAEMKAQSAVVDEYRQRLQNAEETVKGAEETLQNAETQAMNNLRQQAQEQIAQEQAQAQAQAEQTNQPTNDIRALRGGRTVPENPDTVPQGKPKVSPYQSAIKLADAIGVGHHFGTAKMQNQGSKSLHKPIPQNVLGYFQTRAENINVRSKEAGNYLTTMHELWHALGKRLGMDGTAEMIANLDPAFASSYDASELPGEAFAEFGWNYVMGDAQARDFAGDAFVDTFERAAKNAGLYDAIKQAQKEMQIWLNANINDKVKATVRNASEANKPVKGLRHLLDTIVDDTSVAEEVDAFTRKAEGKTSLGVGESLRKMSLMKNFSQRVANGLLTNKLTDSYGNEIGDSLAKRLEDAGVTGDDFDTLIQYWLFKHSFDRDREGKPVFDVVSFPTAQRKAFCRDIEQNHENIVKAEKALQDFRREFLKTWLVDTGFLKEEDLMAMEATYPHYAPTMRIMDQNGGGFRGNRKGFTIRRATGGTQDIINPMDSYVSMIQSVVNMVRANKAAVLFDDLYLKNEGMGVFARDITEDMKKETVNTEGLQEKVSNIIYGKEQSVLTEEQDDVLQRVLNAIGTEQEQWKGTGKVNAPNVLTVVRYGGERVFYQINNPELYNLLASQRNNVASPLLQKVAKLTRAMSALTTGSNPVFALRNFMRDYQNSVNYGSWASNYLWGFPKWLKSAYEVWTKSGEYSDYVAQGGGGWTRIDTGTEKGISDYRGDLFKGYNTRNAAGVAKAAANSLWKLVTFEKLNEVVEQASRYAEYKYGQHDKSTWEGRAEAFLAAQDVTVDFARTGNGRFAADLKAVIPFFGASMQGVYRTARAFTEAERDRMPARFVKTVLNTAITSAICSGLLLKFTPGDDDDEKKDFLKRFAMMSDDLKAGHFYLPNFAPHIFGQAPLIRIPVGQDPLMYAVHGLITNMIWSGSSDETVVDIKSIAGTIIDNLTPIGSTILDPLISLESNKNWYGGNIVPSRMSDWHPTTQYTAETPAIFVNMGRAFGISPMKLQYMAEQYTGFLGQMAIPAMSYDKNTGEIGGLMAAVNAARKRLTSDPLISNDITSSFYDAATLMEQLKKAATNEMPTNMLRRGLSDEEIAKALEEAQAMTKKGGIVYDTKQLISDTYSKIDQINANETLTDDEKYQLTSQARRDMLDAVLDAQEQIGAWKENYVTGRNFVTDALYPGGITHNPTAYETMPDSFKADENEPYMQMARAAYEASGKDAALPHPLYTFSYDKTDYTVAPEYLDAYNNQYKIAYQSYLYANSGNWENISADEKVDILKKAHEKAHGVAKGWYVKYGPKN